MSMLQKPTPKEVHTDNMIITTNLPIHMNTQETFQRNFGINIVYTLCHILKLDMNTTAVLLRS